ncbi:preprotein translocase subunit YajC [Georgenia sp. MJ206]
MEFFIIIALFVGMMWLMGRGGRKAQQAAAEFRANLEVGQNVMTMGGFYGRIVDIDGDAITLESTPGVETIWRRASIQMLADPPFAVVEDEDGAGTDEGADALTDGLEVPDDASALSDAPAPYAGAGHTDAPTTTVADGDAVVIERPEDDEPRNPKI